MKKRLCIFLLLFPVGLLAQAETDFEKLQQQWLESPSDSASLFWSGYKMYSLPAGAPIPNDTEYKEVGSFRHDDGRYLTVGMARSGIRFHIIASAWRSTEEGWKKEMDLLLKNQDLSKSSRGIIPALMIERRKWVNLANEHDPEAHIRKSYTEHATYLSNGRESAGQEAIASRYSYMKNPDYQVELESEFITQVTIDRVLEVGRYFTGPVRRGTGGIYVIVWERQDNDSWKIAFDFNF